MILYHGSKEIVKYPNFKKSKIHNDYGQGFYTTKSNDLAKEWAVSIDNDGYYNKYELDTSNLVILDLTKDKYNILNWLAILLENRTFDTSNPLETEAKEYILNNFMIDYKNYDIIIGYRADDSYFSYARDFLAGTISYRQLGLAMKLGKLGLQIVLKSNIAFNQIKFISYEVALSSDWYSKKYNRDINARNLYLNNEKYKRVKGDIYITNILDEEMKQNDPRL